MNTEAVEIFESPVQLGQRTLAKGAAMPSETVASYKNRHCICLKNFLTPEMLDEISETIPSLRLKAERNSVGAHILLPDEEPSFSVKLRFLLNDSRIFQTFANLTGGKVPKSFYGRFFRMDPDVHVIPWHGDADHNRQVGISINLAAKEFCGGRFQIRRKTAPERIIELNQSAGGDAHVFDVSAPLEHRVTQVSGKVPRDVFSGWFIL